MHTYLLSEEIPIDLLEDNPFNPRINYSQKEIADLAASMEQHGLLVPVKVREFQGRVQLVFGHRRVRAAKLLKWTSIRAEKGSYSDEEMLNLSFAENESRNSLTDYEKGIYFRRMNQDFGKTYEEIGNTVGYSKAHVCNYIRMTQLFDQETISSDKQLSDALFEITEHHARVLAQIEDRRIELPRYG